MNKSNFTLNFVIMFSLIQFFWCADVKASDCDGEYNINANGHKLILTIKGIGGLKFRGRFSTLRGGFQGAIQGECQRLDEKSGTLKFLRKIQGFSGDQYYTGNYSVDTNAKLNMKGVFTEFGIGYNWDASDKDLKSPTKNINCSGDYLVNLNGHLGKLSIHHNFNNSFRGLLKIKNEKETYITGTCSGLNGKQIDFTRTIILENNKQYNQFFHGTFERDRELKKQGITGSFTETNSKAKYYWHALRVGFSENECNAFIDSLKLKEIETSRFKKLCFKKRDQYKLDELYDYLNQQYKRSPNEINNQQKESEDAPISIDELVEQSNFHDDK